GRLWEAVAAMAGGDQEAGPGRLAEDGHPTGRVANAPPPPPPVGRVAEPRDRAAGARQHFRSLVEAHVATQCVGLHWMLGLIVGEGTGQRETAALGSRVAAAGQVGADQMRRAERGVALDDEEAMGAGRD